MKKIEIVKKIDEAMARISTTRGGRFSPLYLAKIILESWDDDDEIEPTEKFLLAGANDWRHYSYSGCALVYDEDIIAVCLTEAAEKRYRKSRNKIDLLEIQHGKLIAAQDVIMKILEK